MLSMALATLALTALLADHNAAAPVRKALPDEPQDSPARLERNTEGFWYARRDHHYFPPPLADLEAPIHYMRGYRARPVRFTDEDPGSPELHTFWDVGFGERFFLAGHDNSDRGDIDRFPNTLPAGVAVFADADVHMLLDFDARSNAVIDADFRLGGGLAGRGIPWVTSRGDALARLSWLVKLFHESTHVGDEFVKAAVASPDFRRVNVSHEAIEGFLAVDTFSHVSAWRFLRAYAGYRHLFGGPYDLDRAAGITHAGSSHELKVGADGRRVLLGPVPGYCRRFLGRVLCPDAGVAGIELHRREQYDFDGTNASPRTVSLHALFGFEWGEVLTDALVARAFVSGYWGINPRGQFRDETLKYLGLTVGLDH